MFKGKERLADLNGIYSEAAVLWSYLPVSCETFSGFQCGAYEGKIPSAILRLFDVQGNPKEIRRLTISAAAKNNETVGKALIFVGLEGKRVSFFVKSENQEVSGGTVNLKERTLVLTRYKNGKIERKKITKNDADKKAYDEIMKLSRQMSGLGNGEEVFLFCRTCPAKIDSLPGPEV